MAASAQKSIGSSFHAKSTATEILAGLDLAGKTAVVTGGYSGIGFEAVKALAAAGVRVVVPARRPDAAEAVLGNMGGVTVAAMDLANLRTVRGFVETFKEAGQPLDILINNAGIMACPEARVGPGWEAQFGVNHLGHMALTMGLLPSLRRAHSARVVALSSIAHANTDILWDDPHFERTDYQKWTAYGQAKTANALFALGLDRREAANGIRAFSVHPGGIFTPLQRHLPDEEMVVLGWKNADGTIPERIQAMFKTPEQGASTSLWAATSPSLDGMGGLYCEDCDVAQLATDDSPRWAHVRPWACRDESADRLWAISEDMLADA